MIPLLIAASLPLGSTVPFREPAAVQMNLPQGFGEQVSVEQFDPVARASELANQLPRQWSGTYQGFAGGSPLAVQLNLTTVVAVGQMVDLWGSLTVGSTTVPIQGNLNAKSDQLDLLLLGDVTAAGLDNGGEFRGLQGFSLSGWRAPRFTNPGGQLSLVAGGSGAGSPGISGLW